MIPPFEQFLYPFLLLLKDGDISLNDLRVKLAKQLKLKDEDLLIKTRNGTMTQFNSRVSWTTQYLRRALFMESPRSSIYRITKRGMDYLKSHNSLTKDDLMQYKEFADYQSRSKSFQTQQDNNDISALTPTEQLEQAFNSIVDDLAEDLLQKVLEQTPQFFEGLVVDLMVKMGYGGNFANSAMVTKYSHDDGIDGIINEDKLGLNKICIQAKRYKRENTIGKPKLQEFSGALDEQKALKGVFITTSSFSKDAREYAEKSGKIALIDGLELVHYMIEYNVGVSTKQVYEVKRIDTDYFEQ